MMNDHGRKFDYRWEFAGKQQESRTGIRRQMARAQSRCKSVRQGPEKLTTNMGGQAGPQGNNVEIRSNNPDRSSSGKMHRQRLKSRHNGPPAGFPGGRFFFEEFK
jgi:hypothetical protein